MKSREYEKKLAQWESEGYDVSELREKWFPAKKSHLGRRLSIVTAICIVVAVVIWLVWPESSAPAPAPLPPPKQEYILSGGPTAAVPIYVDDDLIIEVNGEVIFHDGDKALSTLDPIEFQAYPEDSIHITAIDVGGDSVLSGLYLHSSRKIYRITEGISNPESSELVFYDKTFQISSLPEVTPYVISGGPSALIPIDVDDDLIIEVNGKTIYQDDDGMANILDPIKFVALPGDSVHITATDAGGERKLSSLYLNSDEKSFKITEGVANSESGETVFFDTSFKISEIIGSEILYQDDFSDPESGWNKFYNDKYEVNYIDGEYVITTKGANIAAVSTSEHTREIFKDFKLEVDAREITAANCEYGIIFRWKDKGNFYRFQISQNGLYIVGTQLNGVWGELKRGTSDYIKGGNATNHLTIVCYGSQISAYVNGELLATITDTLFTEGYIGMIAASRDAPVQGNFDNIKVYSVE